jgi:hypothetical protein
LEKGLPSSLEYLNLKENFFKDLLNDMRGLATQENNEDAREVQDDADEAPEAQDDADEVPEAQDVDELQEQQEPEPEQEDAVGADDDEVGFNDF